jgi:hypothetical protein
MNWERWHTLSLLVIIVGVLIGGWLIARVSPLWAWIAVMILLTAFLSIAGKGVTGFWWGALIDDRNMMSLSRLQIILWTIVVLSGFLAAAMTNAFRIPGSSDDEYRRRHRPVTLGHSGSAATVATDGN